MQVARGNPGFLVHMFAWLGVALLAGSCGGSSSGPGDDALNRPPTANAGPDQTVAIATIVQLDGSASTDPDGHALTYRWTFTSRPTGSQAALSSTTEVRPRFTVDVAGTYTVQLIVNDGRVDSQPDTVRIDTLNSPPVADAGPDQTVALGALVQLDGSGSSDADGDPLNFLWTLEERPPGSAAALSNPFIVDPSFVADTAGTYRVRLVVSDGEFESAADRVIVSTANSAPVADAGADQAALVGESVQLDGSNSRDADGDALSFSWSFLSLPENSAAELAGADTPTASFTADAEGLFVVQLVVNDGQVDSAPDTTTVEVSVPPVANQPPEITSAAPTSATVGQAYAYTVTAIDPDGDPLAFSLSVRPDGMTIGAASGAISWIPDAAGNVVVTVVVSDGRGGSDSQTFVIEVTENGGGGGGGPGGSLPPDPAEVAPPHDLTVSTTLYDSVRFLFTGANPIQRGVAADVIDPRRVAVLRGRVLAASGDPLSGVRVSVKDHAEFGWTLSRADGMFDLAVNGGTPLVLDYTRTDYLPVQRRIPTEWRQWGIAPDVVMINLDPNVTVVQLGALTEPMVASGSVETDADGPRQARVLFKPGTTAELVLPGGGMQPIDSISVRATEYTVGERGPERMPGELPLMSGYTYAVELSVDEAIAAGASSIRFSRPVPIYVDNFLGFPVGEQVPLGYYDRAAARWIGADDGRVLGILGNEGGIAALDADGDGLAESPEALATLGIDEAELRRLAELYGPGDSIWRIQMDHFTPMDCNWPYAPPPDAIAPDNEPAEVVTENITDDSCLAEGSSIIDCQNQVLRERVNLAGTAMSLNYASDQVPGRGAVLRIPVTGSLVPGSMLAAAVRINIAGRTQQYLFPAEPGLTLEWEWDGRDVYGREIQGGVVASITVLHRYPLVYTSNRDQRQRSWARSGSSFMEVTREATFIDLRQDYRVKLERRDARRAIGLGGWSLSEHHRYDPNSRTLMLGDGTRRTGDGIGRVIERFAGGYDQVNEDNYGVFDIPATDAFISAGLGSAFGPDGSLYYIEGWTYNEIHRIDPDGVVRQVVSTEYCDWAIETPEACGVGGPASEARFGNIVDLAVGADGTLYFISDWTVILSIAPDGILRHVAGSADDSCWDLPGDEAVNCALEGVATETYLYPFGIDVGPDGDVYVVDLGIVLTLGRIGADGIISTAVGAPSYSWWDRDRQCAADGTAANRVCMAPLDVATGPDGTIYVLEELLDVVRVIAFGSDGRLREVFRATDLFPDNRAGAMRLHAGQDGFLYMGTAGSSFSGGDYFRVVQVDPQTGRSVLIAGTGERGRGADGAPALASAVYSPETVVVAPDGEVFLFDDRRIRRIGSPAPGFDLFGYSIPSGDGSQVYDFDLAGRHLRTRDGLSGTTLLEFGYDENGLLVSSTDADGLITRIERDAGGAPTAIIGPYGYRTSVALDSAGWLASITNPAGETMRFQHGGGGLLTGSTDRRGYESSYTYDGAGRLLAATDRAGRTKTLGSARDNSRFVAALTSALGRRTTYVIETQPDESALWTVTAPSGASLSVVRGADGTDTISYADGTLASTNRSGDPRFGMQVPIGSATIATPGGLESSLVTTQSLSLAVANDPFSIATLQETAVVGNRAIVSTYDGATRTFGLATPAGREFVRSIDARGRPTRQQAGDFEPTVYAYDEDGRLASVTQGTGAGARAVTYAYGENGRVASLSDPVGRTQAFGYDALGRMVTRSLPGGRTVAFEYDPDGNPSAVVTPGGFPYRFDWTAHEKLAAFEVPRVGEEPNVTLYTYDADKALERVERADGQVISYDYDAGGRLSRTTLPQGLYEFAYGAGDRLASITTPAGDRLAYDWDGFLLTGMAWSGAVSGVVERTFDNDFRLTELIVNGDGVTYAHDADDLVIRAGEMTLTRDSRSGLLAGGTLLQIEDAWTRNAFAEIASHAVRFQAQTLYAATYQRDAIGRITRRDESVAGATSSRSYVYDEADRLVAATGGGAPAEAYVYDLNGNRLAGPGDDTYAYDAQDRVTHANIGGQPVTFVHNAFGERVSRTAGSAVTTYRHDALGRLMGAGLPNGMQVDYVLDGRGRRVGKRVDGVLVQGFLWQDGLRPVAELDALGNVVSRFVYAGDSGVPAYMVRGGAVYRIVTDQVGSPRLVVNASSGEILQRMAFDAFGRLLEDTNPGFQPFGFAGGLYDRDTGLVQLGHRSYDPETGRWLSRDPIGFAGGQSNPYAYAINDPVNLVDRTGLAPNETGTGIGVVDSLAALKPLYDKVKEWWGYKNDAEKIADKINAINEALEDDSKTLGQKGWEAFSSVMEICTTVIGNLPGGNPIVTNLIGEMVNAANQTLDKGAQAIEDYFTKVDEESGFTPVQPGTDSDAYIPDSLKEGIPYQRGFDGDSAAARLAADLQRL